MNFRLGSSNLSAHNLNSLYEIVNVDVVGTSSRRFWLQLDAGLAAVVTARMGRRQRKRASGRRNVVPTRRGAGTARLDVHVVPFPVLQRNRVVVVLLLGHLRPAAASTRSLAHTVRTDRRDRLVALYLQD